jgi:hypothetical protein
MSKDSEIALVKGVPTLVEKSFISVHRTAATGSYIRDYNPLATNHGGSVSVDIQRGAVTFNPAKGFFTVLQPTLWEVSVSLFMTIATGDSMGLFALVKNTDTTIWSTEGCSSSPSMSGLFEFAANDTLEVLVSSFERYGVRADTGCTMSLKRIL